MGTQARCLLQGLWSGWVTCVAVDRGNSLEKCSECILKGERRMVVMSETKGLPKDLGGNQELPSGKFREKIEREMPTGLDCPAGRGEMAGRQWAGE